MHSWSMFKRPDCEQSVYMRKENQQYVGFTCSQNDNYSLIINYVLVVDGFFPVTFQPFSHVL